MAAAFNNIANHLVSDSAAAINAGDDLSTIDADESVIGREAGPRVGAPRRRRDDDDDETDIYDDDDDVESLISQPLNGGDGPAVAKPDEDVELPAHACA